MVATDAVLVTDGRAAYGQFADATGIAHITCVASAGERVLGSYHVQNVNGYQSRFKSWMAPFNGVASWVSAELFRLAPHDRARCRMSHAPSHHHRGIGIVSNSKTKQSHWARSSRNSLG